MMASPLLSLDGRTWLYVVVGRRKKASRQKSSRVNLGGDERVDPECLALLTGSRWDKTELTLELQSSSLNV